MQASKEIKKEISSRRRKAMEDWCTEYGVPWTTLVALEQSGINSLNKMTTISQDCLMSLSLNPNERALLRGALLQHKANNMIDKMAQTDDVSERDRLAQSLDQTDLRDMKELLCRRKQRSHKKKKSSYNND